MIQDAKDQANGKIIVIKTAFLKIGVPLWSQYDEG